MKQGSQILFLAILFVGEAVSQLDIGIGITLPPLLPTTTTTPPPDPTQPFYQLDPAQPDGIDLSCDPYDIPPVCGPNSASGVACSIFSDFAGGRYVAGNQNRPDESLPSWINVTLAYQGQQFASNWFYSNLLALILGFGGFSAVPDARDLLLNTGQTVLDPNSVPAALAAFAQVQVWLSDLFNQTSNGQPLIPSDIDESSMLRSLKHIRKIHTAAMTKVSKYYQQTGNMYDASMYTVANASVDMNFWEAMINDLNASSVPKFQRDPPPSFVSPDGLVPKVFNQQSMTMVLFNLGLYPVLMPSTFGIAACDQDIYAFYHLWGAIGYALGIEDMYNPGLQPDLASARAMLADIFNGYIIPSLFNMDSSTFIFLEGNVDAVNTVLPIYTKGVGMMFFMEQMLGIPAPTLWSELDLLDQTTYITITTSVLPELMSDPVYRATLNTATNGDLTTTGTVYFGTDYITNPGRANSCYKTNLNATDYEDADYFDEEYPDYYIIG